MQRLPRPDRQQYEKCMTIWEAKRMSDEDLDFVNQFDLSADLIEENGLYGLMSAVGDVLLPPKFDYISLKTGPFWKPGSRFTVVLSGRYGVVISNGDQEPIQVVTPEYDFIGAAVNYAHFLLDGKWGVLDTRTGKHLIPAEYDSIDDHDGLMFLNGFAVLTKDGKYGVMDMHLNISEVIFDEVDIYFEDIVKVRMGDEWGYLDVEGRFTKDEENAAWYSSVD